MDLGEFEFELSDVDVAAFESVATEDPIQEQQQQHQQQQQQQGSLPQETQVSSAPQQPSTQPLEFQLGQQHQLQTIVSAATTASAASHQATVPTSSNPATSTSRILLVPINSKQGAISGYKQLYQLTTGSSPIATLTAAGNKKQIIQLAPISALTLNNAVTKSISASNNNLNNSISSQLSTNTTATNLNSSTKFNLSYNNSNNNNNNITNDNLRAPTPNSTAPNEVPKRKPCNCTKSQCLKLYCDCFANGEFCSGCNCTNCFNSLSKEKERQKAISQCLERNPEAFRPKIGKAVKAMIGEPAPESIERRHTKGCNCKRSGCLKNYCECYEAKILCSNLCKCCGCKNYEESFERKSLMQLANSASENARGILKNLLPTNTNSNNVCLLQSAQQAEKDGVSAGNVPNLIQSEMGKCLRMIVDSANETSNPKKR